MPSSNALLRLMIEQLKKLKFLNRIPANKFNLKAVFWLVLFFLISCAIQLNLTVSLFLASLYFYFHFRRLESKNLTILNLSLLVLIIFTVSSFVITHRLSTFFIPFCSVPVLATLLFNSLEISLLVTLAGSVSSASVYPMPFQIALLFFVSGITSSMLVLGARKRATIIRAGLAVGSIQLVSLAFFYRLMPNAWSGYLALFLNGLISCVIALGLLPVFEYLFKAATNISLLELADFHHPLLQRMIQDAPGTYHHSLIVGNLSETACQAVGANALLARIGAYYHDIGKLQKPEYFSENQDAISSKHNVLSPTMSKLIIMNHVKEGLDLAKKYKLNPALIDFILQHHGNSLVFYFYRRALLNLTQEQDIKEEGFRYPGPRPKTKETAIVLLADSVEAATRALKEPGPENIKELVHKVINNKFIDGQLDECELTLKDLEKISDVFIRILSGIYHSRISYPDEPRPSSKPNIALNEGRGEPKIEPR